MALLTILSSVTTLSANNFYNFKSISWDWIAIGILVVLFLILLISIIRDFKRNKKQVVTILAQEKCKKNMQNSYLNDINQNSLENANSLKSSINSLINSECDHAIIEELSKHQKNIFANTQEESIFLHIANNKEIGSTEIFKLRDAVSELKDFGLLKNTNVSIDNSTMYPVVANKELIQSIVFLLTRLQIKEHNLKKADIDIILNDKKNTLNISIPNPLKLNKDISNMLENSFEPIYNKSDNKYYGVYLYLINKLTNRHNGNMSLTINSKKTYNVAINLPIDLSKKIDSEDINVQKRLETPKSALVISSDIEVANYVAAYLQKYNFNVDLEFSKTLNKDIPNFLDYDIVLMDAELYEPILSDYILSIKGYRDLKVLSLEESTKIYNYANGLIDGRIDIGLLGSELRSNILKLFNKELVDASIDTPKIEKKATPKVSKKTNSKVLIADDDRTNLHILEYLIKQYNVEVYTACNGLDALEILENNSCDLIILDSIMPKLDGFETIKHIRNNEKYNSTPVVIHTSFSLHKNSIENIFQLGFDSYLPKPFNKYDLKALLERYIPLDDNFLSYNTNNSDSTNQTSTKEDLQEFLAIYGNSDKLIERYIKENRSEQAMSVLRDLKNISNKIGALNFIHTIDEIEEKINNAQEVDSNLIYSLSTNLKELKQNIAKRLNS